MARPWSTCGSLIVVFGASLADAQIALAEIRVTDFETVLFGRVWHVTSYFVQDDLLASSKEDTFLEPEGLAFRSGVLYVSGDREDDETSSRLALYNYPVGGPLSFNRFVQMPNTSPNWWGPEGITFNTSGSGYGGGVNDLMAQR